MLICMYLIPFLSLKCRKPEIFPSSKFGEGTNDIWMDKLKCTGNELDISNCSFPGWGKSTCDHSMDEHNYID
jgi:hypothetical protein